MNFKLTETILTKKAVSKCSCNFVIMALLDPTTGSVDQKPHALSAEKRCFATISVGVNDLQDLLNTLFTFSKNEFF